MSSDIKVKAKKSPISAFLPAMGLILLIAFGVISWVLAPDLLRWTVREFDGFSGNEFEPIIMKTAFAALIFLVLTSLTGLAVAIFVPRKRSKVKENDLNKERKANVKRVKQQKKKQRKFAKQARANTKRLGEE
jgi:predicted membrane protein